MNDPIRIIYTEDLDRASEYLRMALPLMSRHRIPPNPHNYAIWYEYAAGRNRSLREAVDSQVNSGQPFTEEVCQDLYLRFFVQDEQGLEEIRQGLHSIILDVQAQVTQAGGGLSRYSDTLQRFAEILEGCKGLETIERHTGQVLSATRETEHGHRRLNRHLSTAANEVESLRRELEQIREESLTDGLTGVGNRKAFDATLGRAIRLAREQRQPFTVLMVDIDRFKAFNDSYGHLIGDRVLRFVAATLRQCVKGFDKPARFGGEEFTVVLPRTFLSGGLSLAEQIRREVANGELKDKSSGDSYGRITVSIGVAQYRNGETSEDVVKRVDQALYRAKQRGRNRVEQAT